jgi:hypothetical protein
MSCYFNLYRVVPNTLDEKFLEELSIQKDQYRFPSYQRYRKVPDYSEYIGKASLKGFFDIYDRWYNHVVLPENQRIIYLPAEYKSFFDSQYIYSISENEDVLLVKLEKTELIQLYPFNTLFFTRDSFISHLQDTLVFYESANCKQPNYNKIIKKKMIQKLAQIVTEGFVEGLHLVKLN